MSHEPLILTLAGDTPQIDPSAFVAPGARVIGAAELGPESSVWYGATIRADRAPIALGRRSNLQDNATMHADPAYPCTVGADVTIGHNAVVHGCTVGDRCVIGMGAVIMNGAVIGEECLVAGGAVVLEGAEIPAGSLVAGVPAKVRRPLTDAERAALPHGATDYAENALRHRTALDRPTDPR
ncbi:gamma carbonic anhydrase family protein [Enemella evansiae]|uniref:gamma carbonic anhydrase family protein n=1 Tax=Enemella evansiae TaxID=2016499 RepID=UPI000B96D02D|nr:gamma carbonic anhydrase family protein [Enemella evansiae]OYO03145.1 gamma carbonic anhydrase family protein [Enemella evansiae]OYO08117.1 gamma carbonic anhydrase family protein [Enemella evansiae]